MVGFNEWFGQAGLVPPIPSVVSGSFHASLNMVARTELLSLVPEAAAQVLLEPLRRKILQTPWRNPPVAIFFAARESKWTTNAISTPRACFARQEPIIETASRRLSRY